MNSVITRFLAFAAALALGGVVLVQADTASAEQHEKDQMGQQEQQSDQQQAQKQEHTTKQKSEYFSSWSKAEKPGQDYADYASRGLLLIDNALSGISEDVQKQPIGGGPTGEEQQKAQEALKQIDQHRQQIKDLANKLESNANIIEHPQQFQQAAMSTVDVLSSLQQARFPKLEKDVNKVRESVDKIDVNKPLAAQRKDVERFFTHTSDVVSKMSADLEKQEAVGGGPTEEQQKEQKQDQQQPEQKEQQPEQQQQEQQQPEQQPGEQQDQQQQDQPQEGSVE